MQVMPSQQWFLAFLGAWEAERGSIGEAGKTRWPGSLAACSRIVTLVGRCTIKPTSIIRRSASEKFGLSCYCFEAHNTAYHDLKDDDKKAAIDARVAEEKGGLMGASMVSDAFFPFRDGVDVGLNEGISAVVQPGGSTNDYQSIEACNAAGATMVFTGQRSFKH